MSNFIPLHIKTGYSFLSSGILLNRLFEKAKELNYKCLGICDFDVMYGIPEFNSLAKKYNIKPVFGMDLLVEDYYFSLFIKNETGYSNLCKLVSLSHQAKLKNTTISFVEFKQNLEGLIIVFPIKQNKIFDEININFDKNILAVKNLAEDFFVGFSTYKLFEHQHINLIKEHLDKLNISYIPFPEISYLNSDEAIVLDMLQAIKNNTTIEKNTYASVQDQCLQSIDEFDTIFNNYDNSFTKFLSLINFDFDTKRGELINYVKEYETRDLFVDLIYKGVEKRGINLNNKVYKNRLNKEFSVIKKMGYINYFLVVQDYIKYAKEHDIPVGPGRGSAAGSLVAYCLGITDVDPIKYHLLFERFLNEKRNSMPDIDVDFSDVKRDEIIKYLIEKYGNTRVARVCAFQTIAAKQAIRDTARIYGATTATINDVSKLIPSNFKGENSNILTLDYAYNNIPAFKKHIDENTTYKFYFKQAHLIEGLPRQRGLHAAGVILNVHDLSTKIPLDYDSETFIVAEYEKDYLENQGFLKMDLLGLSNLTIIEKCISRIKKTRGISLKMDEIPYDDKEAIQIIKDLKTMGIFQLDTQAALNALANIEPDSFNDIVASISLDRPGPMQFIPNYARRKKGLEKITYLSNTLEPILKETYGVIVYQEQIMQIAQVYSGFNFAEADLFRRAISKKEKSEILKMKETFIKGAMSLSHKEQEANILFNQILRFANYGFNKSHAVCYAMIACKEAYLKAHYPIEFYSAILDQQYGSNDEKFSKYLSEIKKSQIKVLLPDINESTVQFEMYDNSLLLPLLGISGIQTKTVLNILNERKRHGAFLSFIDFVCRMVDTEDQITETQLSKLIDAGVFDNLYSNRKSLKESIPFAFQYANNSIYSSSLLGDTFGLTFTPVNCEDDPIERINNEYEALGVMLSDSPLNYLGDLVDKISITPIKDLKTNSISTIVGMIRNIKVIKIKNGEFKGNPMAFISVYDESDEIDCTLFTSIYSTHEKSLNHNSIVLLTGKKDIRNNRASFLVDTCKILRS